MTDGATGVYLRLLAERAAADQAYLGWALRSYAMAEEQSLSDVLKRLGVAENDTTGLMLSLRPQGERFADMLKAICGRFGADEVLLLVVLRQVEVLESLRTGAVRPDADAGLLLAARMREEVADPSRPREQSETDAEDERRAEGGEGSRAR